MVGTKNREAQLLRLVSELNPAIANLDLISPGQNLYLPITKIEPQMEPELNDDFEEVVTYELTQPKQSPATIVVRSQTGQGKAAAKADEPLPEGAYALKLDGQEDLNDNNNQELTPANNNTPQFAEASYVTSTQRQTNTQRRTNPKNTKPKTRKSSSSYGSGNDGPVESHSDGTLYRVVRVKNGDTLEKILRREGLDPNLIYRQYVKLTVALNPNLYDPDLIIAGAELKIPVGGSGSYYDSYETDDFSTDDLLYAQAGSDTVTDASSYNNSSANNASNTGKISSNSQKRGVKNVTPGGTPVAVASKYRVDTKRLPSAPLPTADSQNARTVLSVIFTRLGETVSSKGRRFLPLDEPPHFDVDTANVPVIDLKNGRHIILDLNRSLSPEFINRFRAKYSEYMIFQPSRGEAMDKALERLWPMCGYYRVYTKDKAFEGGRDVKLSISSNWLVWPTAEDWNKGQPYIINLAPSQDNGTPLPWITFLADHNIHVIDLFGGQLLAGSSKGATPVNNFTVIDVESDNPSAFAAALIKSFGFSPRIGVKVDLVAGRITTGGETINPGYAPPVFWEAGSTKTILEYGDLSTEDLKALRSNGFEIISSAKDSQSVLKSILATLKIKLGGPLVLNGDSSGGPSIKLTINGQTFHFNDRTYLFTTVSLPNNLTSLDPNQNVVVLKYKDILPKVQAPTAPPQTTLVIKEPPSPEDDLNSSAPPTIISEDI
jgi:biotin carboxyl carrier protein